MQVRFELSGGGELADAARALTVNFTSPVEPARRSAIYLEGQTRRAFVNQGLYTRWQELSPLTRFIRAHRAEGGRSQSAQILRDTGRLMSSFFAFSSDDGLSFGAATNVEYAQKMNNGGLSEPKNVRIKGFWRKAPNRGTVSGRWAGNRVAPSHGTMQYVHDYVMHLGKRRVPPRPFFPRDASEMDAVGYVDGVYQIWKDYYSRGPQ